MTGRKRVVGQKKCLKGVGKSRKVGVGQPGRTSGDGMWG